MTLKGKPDRHHLFDNVLEKVFKVGWVSAWQANIDDGLSDIASE